MQNPSRLVEISRLRNIRRNHTIVVPPSLVDAVHLDRQQHWNAASLQILRQRDYRRPTPAMTEQNNPRISLLLRGKTPISVGIQPSDDLLQSRRRLSVFKHRRMQLWRLLLGQSPNDLHLRMPSIILLDKPANETHHNS